MFFARGEEEFVGQACEIPISSLIAVSLLKSSVVSDLELSRLIGAISSCSNEVYILDNDEDPYFRRLFKYINVGGNYFALKENITLNTLSGRGTVRDLLEFIAGDFVLDYTGYKRRKKSFVAKENQSQQLNTNIKVKRRTLFERKKLSKVNLGA